MYKVKSKGGDLLGNTETFLPINRERVKSVLKDAGKTQKQLAEELDITPEHLTRCLTRGKISKTWLIAIAKCLETSEKYLSGESNTALNYSSEHRKDVSSFTSIKEFMISRGFPESYCNEMNSNFFNDIEYFISYICEHHESPLQTMSDNELILSNKIAELNAKIRELNSK